MRLGSRNNQHSFAQIPDVRMARSRFDRSYTVKDTMDFDYLYPIFVDEVIPGDTHSLKMETFTRLATQVVPVMDNMYIDYHFFFVPNRLLYNNWEKLNGAQDNPGDSTSYVMPIMTPGAAFTVDSIFDKFGLPTDVANVAVLNTLPLRAYVKIWNDWYRDENLQNSVTLDTTVGPDVQADFTLLKRGKQKDYFTGCLPWPQKGTAVSIPLGTTAPLSFSGNADVWGKAAVATGATNNAAPVVSTWSPTGSIARSGKIGQIASQTLSNQGTATAGAAADTGFLTKTASQSVNASATAPFGLDTTTLSGTADLSTATAATVNQLRQAIMYQSLLELDARGGTRYVEILKAHFNVISPDFRLQRAEFLGGGSVTLNTHPIAQTSPTSGANAQGQLAAFATAQTAGRGHIGFSKSFVEHGYVIGLACARADITYSQGLNRMWLKSTRYDFFWPKLQELGEQSVLNQEIYCDPAGTPNSVFGYQERYSEYKYRPSEIHGRFRSTYATPLDQWHLAEKFLSQPALNSTFIVQNTPIERAIAIDTEPDLLCDYYFKLTSARPIMANSVPATLGRF